MTDDYRGPTSSEPPLAFDPRRPVRGAGPFPATLVISALVLAVLAGGVFLAYRGGVRHPAGPPPEVGAPLTDFKAPPASDAGTNATGGLTIDKTTSAAASNAAPTFAPPPETPQPLAAAGPPPPPPPPVQKAKPPPAQSSAIADLADAAANGKPVAAPKAAVASAAGASSVQIGAFSSPQLADKGWIDIARLEPGAMAGKGKKVEPIDRDGTTFYRTYITGFASADAAQDFCDRLQAAGKACIVK